MIKRLNKLFFMPSLFLALAVLPSFALGAANYPFPQNLAQPHTALYPAYANSDVQNEYNSWYAEQVTTTGAGPAGASGVVGGVTVYQRVQRNGDPTLVADSTVSEGIGYGMMIAVYMNNQSLFDNLWNYEQLHLDANGLMNWYIDPGGSTDANGGGAATDADEDMAWALVMAHYQWGDTTVFNGTTYNYTTLATKQITAIYNYEVEAGTYVLKPGDNWGGSSATNPSYFDPAEYTEFGLFTGNTAWTSVANEAYTVLFNSLNAASANQSNGLDPAWCNSAGTPVVAFSGADTWYQYDACRTPFRILKDWAFFGDARALSYTAMNNSFFVPIGAGNIVDGYALNGSPDPQYDVGGVTEQAASFVGPAACAAMPQSADASFVQAGYNLLKGATFQPVTDDCVMLVGGQYYDQSWTVLSLLMLSGNYLDYAPVPSPSPTPTPVPTADACQEKIRMDCGSTTSYTSSGSGLLWSADQEYNPPTGTFGYVSWAAGTAATTTGTITGTSDPSLYQTQRYGASLGYDFAVPDGPAIVTFYWAETYATGPGQRVFSVAINGTTVENNLDLYAVTGGQDIAYTAGFPVTVTNGLISISMTASANNALVQAISVQAGPLCTTTVTPGISPSDTPTRTFSSSPTSTASGTLSPTESPTASPTPSATESLSRSASPTPSESPSAVLSSTDSPSVSPSPSFSPTLSPSPLPVPALRPALLRAPRRQRPAPRRPRRLP